MEKIEEIKIVWDKKERNVSQGISSGVFVDGKMLPVASIGVDIGPHGQDYVTLKIHAFRVTMEVSED